MVFGPQVVVPGVTSPSFLFYRVLKVLSFVLPVWFWQKVILLAVFVLAGAGMHRLAAYVRPKAADATVWLWACYAAGLLYICNPFVYTRLVAGQFAVLLGYALLPWLARYAFQFAAKPGRTAALKVALVLVVIGIVSVHTLGLAAVLLAGVGVYGLWRARHDKQLVKRLAGWTGAGLLVFVVLSSYWLVPLLAGHGQLEQTVGGFGNGDVQAFQTVPGSVGLVLNVLALQGFWGDDANLYLTAADAYGWWLVPIVLLWVLLAVGVWRGFKVVRGRAAVFLGVGVVGFVLAIGTAGTWFAPFSRLLFEHVPFFAGYREPQKFAGLLALAYAYFAAFGVAYVLEKLQGRVRTAAGFALCVLPFFCAPLLLFGAQGQLRVTDYPADWYGMRSYLQTHAAGTKTLYLPWHLYMNYVFAGRVIANPAPKFFTVPLVYSNNPELGGATGYAGNSLGRKLGETVLPGAAANPDLAQELQGLGISYVLVAKQFDYHKYDFLREKGGFKLERETDGFILYRVISTKEQVSSAKVREVR